MERDMRLDLHVHTCYSEDARLDVKEMVKLARTRVDGIAITDHNEIKGALRALKMSEEAFLVIPGIEVSSSAGHILGLNVREKLAPGLTPAETAEQITALGGIAVAAHPFKIRSALGNIARTIPHMAIETFNSRCMFNRAADKMADELQRGKIGGSDCHFDDVGRGYTELEHFAKDADDVTEAIARARTAAGGSISQYILSQSIKSLYLWLRRRAQPI